MLRRLCVINLIVLLLTPGLTPLLYAEDDESRGQAERGGTLAQTQVPQFPVVSVIPAATESLIDLPAALQLAESLNPQIGLGREAIREALALQLGARSLLLPDLNAGANYHLHSGSLQTSFGQIRTLNEQSVYFGSGSRTLAAETVAVPGVRIFSQLGEAIYAPLAAQQFVAVRSAESQAIDNSMLLQVASRYLDLVGAEARLEALRDSLADFAEIERTTGAFAKTGQGREGDYKRAQAERFLIEAEEQQGQENVALASAELVRLLHLDPCIRLTTIKAPIELLTLVDTDCDLEQLVQTAFVHRPEVMARSAAIGVADARLKQEMVRPFLPLLSVGFSAGGFGGGSNRQDLGVSSFYQTTGARTDFDVSAIWTLQNLGFGNYAIQNQRRAERDQSISQRVLTSAQIRREVTEALAILNARRKEVGVTNRQLKIAHRGALEEFTRTRAGEGLPIEALDSMRLLAKARQEYITAVVGFNTAQFQLFVAIGETPTDSIPDPKETPGVQVPAPQ